MGFGIDTINRLTYTTNQTVIDEGLGIDWKKFYKWKGTYPTFAGRYFGGGGATGYSTGEFKSVYETTGMSLIFPIQGAKYGTSDTGKFYYGQSYYSSTGTNGYNYGVHDAQAICGTLNTVLSTTELHVPSGGLVIVYLDVEKNDDLKSAYWAGWANTVHTYTLSDGSKPFIPGVYCPYWANSSGKMVPATSVQTVLANAYKYWTSSNVRCRGLWTSEPEPEEYCTSGADVSSAWSQFATSTQTLSTGTVEVPLYLWQYAESGVCTYTYGVADFAGGQILDLDGSDSTGAETYMFNIVS